MNHFRELSASEKLKNIKNIKIQHRVQVVIRAKLLFWVKAVSSSMGVIQNKIIQSFFSMGETCDKLVRLSQAFFIYTELKLLYKI